MPVRAADMIAPAMACLRVSIFGAPAGMGDGDQLQAVVAKVISAFLETRWEWPRKFEQMTPYAFVLTDPHAQVMDKRGLRALAAELQVKLFGAEGEGEVSLLMFEGADVEVKRFAHLPAAEVQRLLDGAPLDPPFAGALDRFTAGARPAPGPSFDLDDLDMVDEAPAPPPRPAMPPRNPPLEALYGGFYLTVSESFIGCIALCRRERRDRFLSPDLSCAEPLPGMEAEAFDEGCVDSARLALAQDAPGLLFVPLSFSSLVRPAGRRAYARFLSTLPAEDRARLGAAIYDTPRAPSYYALSAIRRFLEPFFGEINLHVSDPAFEIDRLARDTVSSVTLALPDRDPAERMAAIRRFMQALPSYRRKRIWAGVSGLSTRAEIDACLALRTPVIAGPAVTELGHRPVGPRSLAAEALPLSA